MLAPYPLADERLADAKAETDMEAVKAAIHAGRSLRSSYGILPSVSRPHRSALSRDFDFFSLVLCLSVLDLDLDLDVSRFSVWLFSISISILMLLASLSGSSRSRSRYFSLALSRDFVISLSFCLSLLDLDISIFFSFCLYGPPLLLLLPPLQGCESDASNDLL